MSNEYCCCGCVHVKTGAFIIGLMYLISGPIFVVAILITGNSKIFLVDGYVILIGIYIYSGICFGGSIIYADRMHTPRGYIPYVICSAVLISIYTIFIYIFLKMVIFMPETLGGIIYPILYPQEKVPSGGSSSRRFGFQRNFDGEMTFYFDDDFMTTTPRAPYGDKSPMALRLELLFMATVMVLTDRIAMWFLSVVFRAYRYMKIEFVEPYLGEPCLDFDRIIRYF